MKEQEIIREDDFFQIRKTEKYIESDFIKYKPTNAYIKRSLSTSIYHTNMSECEKYEQKMRAIHAILSPTFPEVDRLLAEYCQTIESATLSFSIWYDLTNEEFAKRLVDGYTTRREKFAAEVAELASRKSTINWREDDRLIELIHTYEFEYPDEIKESKAGKMLDNMVGAANNLLTALKEHNDANQKGKEADTV